MIRYAKSNLCWSSVLAVAFCCALVQAQQPADDATTEQLAPETNPAVLAALELPRTKPSDYVSAILALVDLGRPELAKPILEELQAQNLNEAQCADLVREFGTQRMMRLEREPALAPTAGEFADSCLAAAAAEARSPDRLKQLLDQLADPSPETHYAAIVDLSSAGMPGVIATVEALGREPNATRRAALADALIHMQPLSIGPLVALFETNNHDVRADVMRLLAQMGVKQMRPLIAAEAVREPQTTGIISGSPQGAQAAAVEAFRQMAGQPATPALAERLLVDSIDQYRRGALPSAPDESGRITIWQWNGGSRTLKPRSFTVDDARTVWMARLALALAELWPADQAHGSQFLVLGQEADRLKEEADIMADESLSAPGAPGGYGHTPPLLNELLATGDDELISRALSHALKGDYPRAAEGLVEVIGARRNPSALAAHDGQPALLVEALHCPDRRVRFTALAAIMRIAPGSPFPGSSRVPETLGYFARGTGERQAVVAMPTIERAANVAGRLRAAGIDAAPANRGAEAVRLAQQSPDVEFVLVDMDIQAPGVRDVLYALRIDPATGHVPIGLLAGEGRLEAAQALAAEHQRVLAFSRPHSDERTTAMADRLIALDGHGYVPPEERADQSADAIAWLGELAISGPAFYDVHAQSDVILAAAQRPDASPNSLAALAALGTPAGQRALVDLASLQTIPIATRREAAQAFDLSIQEYGLLLTSDQIVRQYNRYNASATADADTQQVLGAVLDTIETQRTPLQTPSHAP